MSLFTSFGLKGGINTKDRDYSVELDADEEMVLNRILNKISVRAAVRLIETDVKFISTSNIHFVIVFDQFHVASISICFRGHKARSTVRKFLLYIRQ